MMHTLVSVIMPCLNASRWITSAVNSILSQTHRNLELIVVDDGSTDQTPNILATLARNDARIKILRTPCNSGIVAALNRGLDSAQGDAIARLDSDDIATPNRLSRQLMVINDGIDLCGSWFTEFGLGIPRIVRWPCSAITVRTAMLFQNAICHPTVMAKRSVFERFRYREEYSLAEDYDLFGRACAEFRVENVPEVLVRYRRHKQQMTLAKREAMEIVTRRIRLNMLHQGGFDPTQSEERLHNLIRSPSSISNLNDLHGVEAWLLKLLIAQEDMGAQRVIASQWIRACVRAAPLGKAMWKAYRASSLRNAAEAGMAINADLLLLSAARLEYHSRPFALLRRFGFSA